METTPHELAYDALVLRLPLPPGVTTPGSE
jgi:hypothetical protein